LGFVRISNDPFHAGQGGQFLRCALRVAARHQDAGTWIFAMYAAHRLANVVIRGGSDRAGVQNYQVGLAALAGGFQALAREQRFKSGAIRLGSPASKILHEKLFHCRYYSGAEIKQS
jgi:hypothetical protein